MNPDTNDELFDKAQRCLHDKDKSGELQELINQGLDVNKKDEYGTSLAARAIYGLTNFNALYILWKANAIPDTNYLVEIFGHFEKGKTPNDFYEEEKQKKKEKFKKAKDITKSFSVKKLQIDSASFEIEEIENDEDSTITLTIKLKPFIFEDHYTETEFEFTGYFDSEIISKIFEKDGYEFKEDEIELSSIYIFNCHNPVDLKKLTVIENDHIEVIAKLYFDFEYESDFKSEEIIWKFKIEK